MSTAVDQTPEQAPGSYRRHRLQLVDYLLALVLFGGYLAFMLSTMQMGFTRDEGYYFHAGHEYFQWFDELGDNLAAGHSEDSFTQENIDRHWISNPEHPVLMKTLFGLSWHAFSEELDWLSPSTAMRLPTAALTSLLIALVFLFSREAFGSRVGAVFSALALGLMPHVFFHGHLSCFDAPITTFWFLVVYAYWRSLRSRLWGWLTGIFFGLALITKLNAFFIPAGLLAHWVMSGLHEFRVVRHDGRLRLRIPSIPLAFVAMAFLGPLIFYWGWPLHWYETFDRIIWYFGRHLNHEHYFVEYFGQALVRPPFPPEYSLMLTLLTVPVVTLAAGAVGGLRLAGEWWQKRKREPDPRATGWLVLIMFVLPIGVIAVPGTPVFGGTKHWMPAMPFLAMAAGAGVCWVLHLFHEALRWRGGRVVRALTTAGLVVLLTAPLAHATLYAHPFGSSYFNELAGGIRGSAELRMIRQFWGDSTRIGLAYLSEIAPRGASVFPHDANSDDMHWYRADGLLRDDIRDAWDPYQADYAFFNHQRAFVPVTLDIWRATGTHAPIRVWTLNGVPELSLYGGLEARQGLEADPANTEHAGAQPSTP